MTETKKPQIMFNLYDIVKCVLKSKSPKEYIKKVKTKEFVHGFYLISKDNLILILEKTKALAGKNLLEQINKNEKTGYELSKEELIEKYKNNQTNYFDIGTQLINYGECKVKYLYDDESNVYFRAKDICNILEYKNTNDAVSKHINDIDKINYKNINSLPTAMTLGNEREDEKTIYINESGLYTLMLSSQQKQALKFKDWICRDVLPSIRKHGYYNLMKQINMDDYTNKNCMYVFRVEKNYYKYGITKDLRRRMNQHKSNGLLKKESDLVKVFVVDRYDELMNIENSFKNYCKDKNINKILNNSVEFFKSNDITIQLKKINELINDKVEKKEIKDLTDKSVLNIEMLRLQVERVDKELEIEKIKLNTAREERLKVEKEIELEKLKQENKVVVNKVINNNSKTINNITNITKEEKEDSKKCNDCNKVIKNSSTRCLTCENKQRFLNGNGKRPSFEQLLKDKIKLTSYTKIGKKYGVSDNAVRKWFKTFEKYGFTIDMIKVDLL